jgi:hypothetical protein
MYERIYMSWLLSCVGCSFFALPLGQHRFWVLPERGHHNTIAHKRTLLYKLDNGVAKLRYLAPNAQGFYKSYVARELASPGAPARAPDRVAVQCSSKA